MSSAVTKSRGIQGRIKCNFRFDVRRVQLYNKAAYSLSGPFKRKNLARHFHFLQVSSLHDDAKEKKKKRNYCHSQTIPGSSYTRSTFCLHSLYILIDSFLLEEIIYHSKISQQKRHALDSLLNNLAEDIKKENACCNSRSLDHSRRWEFLSTIFRLISHNP